MKSIAFIALSVLLLTAYKCVEATVRRYDACLKRSYVNGVGRVPNRCSNSLWERKGALCYSDCAPGYEAVGLFCVEICHENETDLSATCVVPGDTYQKGCCCCVAGECCNTCKEGYTDFGCTCTRFLSSRVKRSYPRDSQSLVCETDEMYNVAGLCYDNCRPGYYDVASVCWQNCRSPFSVSCGVYCASTEAECKSMVSDSLLGLLSNPAAPINQLTSNYGQCNERSI